MYRARFVVSAVGQLNQPAWPDIPDFSAFSGKLMHSATWDTSYDLSGKTVAVIGNGASAVQLIPEVAKKAKHLTVFQRSPNWIVERNDRKFREIEGYTQQCLLQSRTTEKFALIQAVIR